MGMTFEGESSNYSMALRYINIFFTAVFFIECLLKLFGQGPYQYFLSGWNQFDFSIVLASIIDFIMDIAGSDFIAFLSAGPQLLRVLRVLRVSRIFK